MSMSPLSTVALCLAFLFHVGTQAALLFDVHEIAPVPFLLFLVLWQVEAPPTPRRRVVVVVALLLLAGTKESALVYAAFTGLYLLLFRPGWRGVGAACFVAGLVAFVVVIVVVQPALLEEGSAGMIHLNRFGGGTGGAGGVAGRLLQPGQTLASLISPDVKLTTIGVSGAGYGFLSLVSGEALVLGLPVLAERFLADKQEMWGVGFHYGLVSAAVLAVGALQSLLRAQAVLSRAAPRLHFDICASVFLMLSCVGSQFASPSPPELGSFTKPYYADDATVARYRRALAFVDVNVGLGAAGSDAVVAQNHFLPHLALREHIWLPEGRFIERADVVVLDTAASAWPKEPRFIRRLVDNLRKDPRFAVAFHEETTWVFRRVLPASEGR
jgi:uncharacterized membrane protein